MANKSDSSVPQPRKPRKKLSPYQRIMLAYQKGGVGVLLSPDEINIMARDTAICDLAESIDMEAL
jgi:hypothetical protein